MKFKIAAVLATIALGLPAHADGDADKGEKEFKKCKACHAIGSPDATIVKGGATGPNLYGVTDHAAGSVEGFRYSDLLVAANAQGIEWTEENFVGYVQDPTEWLKEATGENGRGKMTYKVRKEDDAKDLYAYLSSLTE
ncbi:MAG: c-type cytochrome [Roseovarius sp.]|nr:c-type cytochrome [Roseovarius sp.]